MFYIDKRYEFSNLKKINTVYSQFALKRSLNLLKSLIKLKSVYEQF